MKNRPSIDQKVAPLLLVLNALPLGEDEPCCLLSAAKKGGQVSKGLDSKTYT